MQSDTPQGDPRLQRTDSGPKVATGYVDPCIVYLETTLKGEIPLVLACWAKASREIHEPGKEVQLELQDVVTFRCEWRQRPIAKRRWSIFIHKAESLILKHGIKDRSQMSSYLSPFQSDPPPVCQWAIRYLESGKDASLRADFNTLAPNFMKLSHAKISSELAKRDSLSRKVFAFAALDWPSIAEILASLQPLKPRPRRASLVRRLISSVFKKKPKPVPA